MKLTKVRVFLSAVVLAMASSSANAFWWPFDFWDGPGWGGPYYGNPYYGGYYPYNSGYGYAPYYGGGYYPGYGYPYYPTAPAASAPAAEK